MPRKKSVPSYRKHSSGQARVTINGRDYLLGPHDSPESRERYGQLIAEWSASSSKPAFGLSSKTVVAELVVAYMEHAERYYGLGPKSEYHRIKTAMRPLRDLYATLAIENFGPEQYKAVRQKFIDRNLARTYINSQMKLIVRCIKWGVGEGIIPASVHQALTCVSPLRAGRCDVRETDPVKPVPQDVIDRTLPHLSPVVADMARVQLLTGARPSEICQLTPALIDRSSDVWFADLRRHKTARRSKSRTIYFGPEAQETLLPYLLRADDECLFQPCEAMAQLRERQRSKRKTKVQPSQRVRRKVKPKRAPGKKYTTQAYGRSIAYVCKREGIPHWSPNQLRHTRATELRAKYGIEVASAVLGHARLTTTEIYAEKSKKKARDAMAKTG